MRAGSLAGAIAALLGASPVLAEALGPQDLLAIGQLRTLALEARDPTPPSEAAALHRVTSRQVWAGEVADLLRERKPLSPFGPVTWLAISPEVCRAAGLDQARCLSLPCLIPQINPADSKHCPSATAPTSAKAVQPPDDPAALSEWLRKVAESAQPPLKARLQAGELPVDQDVVTAKGVLHAIWPDVLEAAGKVDAVKPENIQPLVHEVLLDTAARAARAARLVAAARTIRGLPPTTRALVEPSATQFLTRTAKVEELFRDQGGAVPLLPNNVRELRADLDAADDLLASIGGRFAVDAKPAEPGGAGGRPAGCAMSDGDRLRGLAGKKIDGRRVSIALRGGAASASPGDWELVATITARDGTVAWQAAASLHDKRVEQPVAAECVVTVIPLGITISNLAERDGKLVYAGSETALTQRTASDQFEQGLDELLRQVGEDRQGLPKTVVVDDPRLSFSSDLRSVALTFKAVVPVLDVTVPLRVNLVEDGVLVLKPSAAGLLNYDALASEVARVWKPRVVKIGPIDATVTSPGPAGAEFARNGTWLTVAADLRVEGMELGQAKARLVDRAGSPALELDTDLTTLIRGPLGKAAQAGGELQRRLREALPGLTDRGVLDDVAGALRVEQARISPKGDGIEVRLALDLAAITGTAGASPVSATGILDLKKPDLGIGEVYKSLLGNVLRDVQNFQSLVLARFSEKLGRQVQNATDAAVADVIAKANVAILPLGIKLAFKRAEKSAGGTLRTSWEGGGVDLGTVTVVPGLSPRIDFSGGSITDEDGRRLGLKLQDIVIARLKSSIGLSWTACGKPRATRSGGGIHLEFSAQAPLVGCLPLPSVVFNGMELLLDGHRTEDAVKLVLVEKLKLLIPSELRDHIGKPRWENGNTKVTLEVQVRAPGTTVDLKGKATVDLATGAVQLNADPSGVAFEQVLKHFTGLVGSGVTVVPVPGRFALRASANIDFGAVGVQVREMELTPQRVYLPEIGVKLPAAVVIGPFTVFPLELRAKLEKPVQVGIVGDASFAGAGPIVRVRSRIDFGMPNPRYQLAGTLTVAEVLDLFEMKGSIDLEKRLLDATARTTGVLAAIMPAEQRLVVDPSRAQLDTSLSLLLLAVKGRGEILFTGTPSMSLDGTADLAGFAGLKAKLATDLQLRRPSASVEGGIGLPPIGKIAFGASASVQSVRIHASIIGIQASLVLPSLGDLNGDLVKKLFENLLRPSIDLKNLQLKNVTVTLAPKIGGGGGDTGPGGKGQGDGRAGGDGDGDGGGPQVAPAPPGQGRPPIADPADAIRTGTVPSEWQSGWLPVRAGMLCEARWKGRSQVEWVGRIHAPKAVATMLAANRPALRLGSAPTERTVWSKCTQNVGSSPQTVAIALFDGTSAPKIWRWGTDTVEDGAWMDATLKQLGSPGAAGITWGTMPSAAAASVLQILYESRLAGDGGAAVRAIRLVDGKLYYRIDPASGGVAHLVEASSGSGQTRSFRADDPLGRLVLQATADPPAPEAALRDTLLPLLFEGGEPRVLSDADGRLLLAVAPSTAKPFIASFRASPPRCGTQVDLEDAESLWRSNDLFDPIASTLLAEEPSCTRSGRWTTVTTVADDGGAPQRVVGLRDKGAGDWSLDFVDIKGKCLRSGLTGPALMGLVEKWAADGLPQAEVTLKSIAKDKGLAAVVDAIRTPDIGWRATFRLDPFLLAVCGRAG